jgi:hypothetical protein
MSPLELLNQENRTSEDANKTATNSSDNKTHITSNVYGTVRDPWDLEQAGIESTLDDLESEGFSWNPFAKDSFEQPVVGTLKHNLPELEKKVLPKEVTVPELPIKTEVETKKLKDFKRLTLAIFDTEIEKLQVPATMQVWVDNYRLFLHKSTKEKDIRDYAAKLNQLYTSIANFNDVESSFGSTGFDEKVLKVTGGFQNRLLAETNNANSLAQFEVYTKQLQQLFITMKSNDLEGIQAVIDNKDLRRALPENFFKKSVVEKVALTWKDRIVGLRESFTNIFTSKKEKKFDPKTEAKKQPKLTMENSVKVEVLNVENHKIKAIITKVRNRNYFKDYLAGTQFSSIFEDLIANLKDSKTFTETSDALYEISVAYDLITRLDGLDRDIKTAINFGDVDQIEQLTEDYNSKQKEFFTLMCQFEQSINFNKKAKGSLVIPEIIEPELGMKKFVPFRDIQELVSSEEIQPFRELWETINVHPNKEKVYRICMMIKKFLVSLQLMKLKKISGLEIREYIIYNSLNIRNCLDEMNMNYFLDLLENDLGFGPKNPDLELSKQIGLLRIDDIEALFSKL